LVTVDQLNDIIAKGEQLDVEFKSDAISSLLKVLCSYLTGKRKQYVTY